jgi:hypothetical protein
MLRLVWKAVEGAGAAGAGGRMVQRWLTASSSQSLSSAAQPAACMEELPLPGSHEARLAVLYSTGCTPHAPLLKVAAEAVRLGCCAGCMGLSLLDRISSSGSAVLGL